MEYLLLAAVSFFVANKMLKAQESYFKTKQETKNDHFEVIHERHVDPQIVRQQSRYFDSEVGATFEKPLTEFHKPIVSFTNQHDVPSKQRINFF